jgi:hypothetical protein
MVRKNFLNAKIASRVGAFGVGLSLLMSAPVYAVDSSLPVPQHPAKPSAATRDAKADKNANRLSDEKRRVCEQRVEAIRKIARRAADQGEAKLATTDKVSQRTQNFYVTKKLAVPNYAQLTGDVAAKRAAVVSSIHQGRVGTNVTCSGSDPKAQGQTIRNNIQAMQNAIKQYNASVKVLVTTVQTAAKAASK